MKATILLYNVRDKRRKTKLSGFCAMYGIRVRVVEKEDYQKELAEILEIQDEAGIVEEKISPSAEAPDDFEEEMLVMCGLGVKANPLLAYLRKERIVIPLKAMLTPTNQFWNSLELYAEINEERRQLSGQQ